MPELSLPTTTGFYGAVRDIARELANDTISSMKSDENCIGYAAALQDAFYDQPVSGRGQNASIECGVICTINPDKGEEKRVIHFSNYILAISGAQQAVIEVDSWKARKNKSTATIDTTRRVAGRTDPVNLTASRKFGHYSVAIGQRSAGHAAWQSAIAPSLGETPFDVTKSYEQKIVMGPNAGRLALRELRDLGRRKIDTSRLPIMLIQGRR